MFRARIEDRPHGQRRRGGGRQFQLDAAANTYHSIEIAIRFAPSFANRRNRPKAFDILFERMMRRVMAAGTGLVARLLDRPQTDPEVRIKTLMLFGQTIFFCTAREAALRVLCWPDFESRRLALVKKVLHAQAALEFGATTKTKRRSRS